MRLLVTGGCGFIGSHFIRHILDTYPQYEVVNLDCLTYAGSTENTKEVEKNKNYRFIKGDIRASSVVKKLMSQAEVVVNFAAQTHVDRSLKEARIFVDTNVTGTLTLLEAARNTSIKMFVQISTDEVYGSISEGAFMESDTLNPTSPYAASKAAADLLCMSFSHSYQLPVIIIRSSNNFGPNQYPEKIIPLFITSILKGKKVPLYGDGANIRDWMYVLDNVRALDFILHKGEHNQIYNVSANNEISNLDLTRHILEKFSLEEGWIGYVKDRPAHDRRYALDASKIRTLGWKPVYDFDASLDATIDWYKHNERWWQKKTGHTVRQ